MTPAAYVLGLLCVLTYVQAGHFDENVAIIEDLREADLSWRSARIVSGWEAEEGQIPYQGSLRMVNAQGAVSSCGCSLIYHHWVVTAAHCVANRDTFIIRLGLTNLTRPDILIEATNKFIHPQYNETLAGVQPDDIALISFDYHIYYTPNIRPIRLQSTKQKDTNYAGVTLRVSGFGRTNDLWNGGVASDVLLWTLQRGVSNADCLSFYAATTIRDQIMCAGYYNVTSQSSCQGDSGGPLILTETDGLPTMVGIVSFGHVRGCSSEVPSGYVRPGYYHDWYKATTGVTFDWDSDA